jgi:hypothetical protein
MRSDLIADSLGGPRHRSRWILVLWPPVVFGLAFLMSLPAFDPTSYRGSWLRTIVVGLWATALLIGALGLARRNAARIGFKTLIAGAAVLALIFGALPGLPMQYAVLAACATASAWMLYEAWSYLGLSEGESPPYRGIKCRLALCAGGSLGLAQFGRVLTYIALYRLHLI